MADPTKIKARLKRRVNVCEDWDLDQSVEDWWDIYSDSSSMEIQLAKTSIRVLEEAQGQLRMSMDATIGSDSMRLSQVFANITTMLKMAKEDLARLDPVADYVAANMESCTPENTSRMESNRHTIGGCRSNDCEPTDYCGSKAPYGSGWCE